MYKGFPIGYLLFWSNNNVNGARQIGEEKKKAVPRLLIVDGQQRLTSLYAVLKDIRVKDADFKDKHISIAFRPRGGTFKVTNAIIEKDPEFIPDISEIWSGKVSRSRFVRQYIETSNTHNVNISEK